MLQICIVFVAKFNISQLIYPFQCIAEAKEAGKIHSGFDIFGLVFPWKKLPSPASV